MAEAFAVQDYKTSGEILSQISGKELLHEQIADGLRSAIRQRLHGGGDTFCFRRRRRFNLTGERDGGNCNS